MQHECGAHCVLELLQCRAMHVCVSYVANLRTSSLSAHRKLAFIFLLSSSEKYSYLALPMVLISAASRQGFAVVWVLCPMFLVEVERILYEKLGPSSTAVELGFVWKL